MNAFDRNSAATEVGKILPSEVPKELTWDSGIAIQRKAMGQPFPTQGRDLCGVSRGFEIKSWNPTDELQFFSLSQTQIETHKAESKLVNLPTHAFASQMRRLWFRYRK